MKTPEQEDDYYKNRGPIPPFRNEYGCIQDVVGYTSDDGVLGKIYVIFLTCRGVGWDKHTGDIKRPNNEHMAKIVYMAPSLGRAVT